MGERRAGIVTGVLCCDHGWGDGGQSHHLLPRTRPSGGWDRWGWVLFTVFGQPWLLQGPRGPKPTSVPCASTEGAPCLSGMGMSWEKLHRHRAPEEKHLQHSGSTRRRTVPATSPRL